MNIGRLILVGAPLGNPADLSPRAIAALAEAEVIYAEDTRRFRHLAQDLALSHTREIHSFFAGNENERLPELRRYLTAGKSVLVITDGGMPGVSDPGYLAISSALEVGAAVDVIPGPSAVTTALVLSGLPMERFIFDGFVPRTEKARVDYLYTIKNEMRTIVLFEAPHRSRELVANLLEVFGGARRVALCREMTKKYEEVFRGTIKELHEWITDREILGEVTLVIEGAATEEVRARTPQEISEQVALREGVGMERKAAVAAVAEEFGLRKREVFDALVASKMEQ